MSKPYKIMFTEAAKAAAEGSYSLAAFEARARAEIDRFVLCPGEPTEMDLPSWGFCAFEMRDDPEGEFIAHFYGDDGTEIDAIERHQAPGEQLFGPPTAVC